MSDNNFVNLSDYIDFDKKRCSFFLTREASELIYNKKQAICSYSGASEWCHHFFCQLLDLYSGNGPYNYALNSYEHERMMKQLCEEGHAAEVANWILRHKGDLWFQCAVNTFAEVIDRLPNYDD